MSHVFHSVYGLRLRADRSLPGLTPEREPGAIDLDVHLGTGAFPSGLDAVHPTPHAIGGWTDENGEPGWRMWELDGGRYYRLRYADDTEFLIERMGTDVWAKWSAPLTLEDTATYLLGPVLRLVLGLRGVLCLHASAVVIGERAVALVGPAGMGKSTTAAAFAARGTRVLSDDLVALAARGGEFLVQPGYRLLRLWPDVAPAVCASPDALPCLTLNWDKRFLALTDRTFAREPVPLSAIYLLSDARNDDMAPWVAPVSARDALMDLVANSRSSCLVKSSVLANEYRMLGRVRQAVRIRRLVPHASLERLQRLCDVIEQDLHEQPAGLPARDAFSAAGASR